MELTPEQISYIENEFDLMSDPKYKSDPDYRNFMLSIFAMAGHTSPDRTEQAERLSAEYEAEKKKREHKPMADRLHESGIPQKYIIPPSGELNTEYWPEGFAACRKYAEFIKQGRLGNLFLSGASHHGKTTLAGWAALRVLEYGYSLYWCHVPRFYDLATSVWSSADVVEKGELEQIHDKIRHSDCVVWDDIVKRPIRSDDGVTVSAFGNKLQWLLEYRANSGGKFEIVTSELPATSERLRKVLTASIANRFTKRAIKAHNNSSQDFESWIKP